MCIRDRQEELEKEIDYYKNELDYIGSDESVSYTHLDVYKRQEED